MPAHQRRPLMLGNWKMNTSLDEAKELANQAGSIADRHPGVDVGILPPAIWLVSLHELHHGRSRLRIGAQDVSEHPDGAYTGDVSVTMLAPWCDEILIGHSERRQHHHETDQVVRAKLDAVLTSDCTPVVAVGESETDRDAGNAESVVERQLQGALHDRPHDELARIVIAYEPVWAIGTGKSASATDAQEMAATIRRWVGALDTSIAERLRVLYGGSVKSANASEILSQPDVDGGLVGGASLSADEFGGIVQAAAQTRT